MPDASSSRVRSFADWIGITASAACALHCLVVPALLVSGTLLPASFLADEAFHKAMIWVILPAALIAFGFGSLRHRDRGVILLGASGVIGIIISATLLHDLVGEQGERIGTVISGALLILAHVRNFRLCRVSDHEHQPA